MNLKTIIIGLAVIFALALIYLGFANKNAPTPGDQAGTNLTSPAGPTVIAKQDNEDAGVYEIKVQYPEFSGVSNAAILNANIRDNVMNQVTQFKSDEAANAIKELSAKSSFQIEYSVGMLTADIASVKFTTFYYIRGMAHPATQIWTVNYDFMDGKPIDIEDLFDPGADYLHALQAAAKPAITQKLQAEDAYIPDFVDQGTAPKAVNYSSFTLRKDKLTIIFNQYQVAPGAAGDSSIEIPFSAFASVNGRSQALRLVQK